ncbi:MAG: ATP synthase F0 subunit B, partial [Deltaproteobacteria bacterium]|nr:ATP synthase F0 subunit B [Deltaproteobacteria bacterium]
ILLFALNKVLYKPILAMMEERRKKTEDSLKDAEAVDEEVAEGLDRYNADLKVALVKAQDERTVVRQEAAKREKEVMEKARKDAASELVKLRTELSASAAEASEKLKAESKDFSKEIATNILGRTLAVLIILLLPVLIFLNPENAFASSSADATSRMWKNLNFLLLVIGIYVVWRKWIKGMLDGRADGIKKALKNAERARLEAEKKLAEFKEQMSGLDRKVEEIRMKLRAEAELEKDKILKDAAEQTRRIAEQAKITVDQEVKKATIEIRKEITEMAIKEAEGILGREVNGEDQSRITKEYLEKIRIN